MDGRLFCSIAADGTRLLVLDLLERPGAIFAATKMVEWTSIGKKRRYTFRIHSTCCTTEWRR